MIIEILPKIGGQPIRIEAAQFVVLNEVGTPIAVAGEYGIAGAVRISKADEKDFNQTLRVFGYGEHDIVCEQLQISKTTGAVTTVRK